MRWAWRSTLAVVEAEIRKGTDFLLAGRAGFLVSEPTKAEDWLYQQLDSTRFLDAACKGAALL